MLQCMREPKDVHEYLDGEVKKLRIRRLLEFLSDIEAEAPSTPLSFEVRLRSISPWYVAYVHLVIYYPLCLVQCSLEHVLFMRRHHDVIQAPEMQVVLDKGLTALSVREMGQVLSHLGLDCFVTNFKKHEVIDMFVFCVLACMRLIPGLTHARSRALTYSVPILRNLLTWLPNALALNGRFCYGQSVSWTPLCRSHCAHAEPVIHY